MADSSFSALMPYVPALLQGFGSGMEYGGNMNMADNARVVGARQAAALQFQSEQLRQNAGQQVAAAQRDADEVRRQGDLAASRAKALAAASGAGATDPTVVHVISDMAGMTSYNAAAALYRGEAAARAMRLEAASRDYDAAMALSDSKFKANAYERAGAMAIVKGGLSLAARFAYDKPKPQSAGGGQWVSGESLPSGYNTVGGASGLEY